MAFRHIKASFLLRPHTAGSAIIFITLPFLVLPFGKEEVVIADGNDIKNSKPAPDVFLVAAEKLGIEPKECMVVEDAEAGVDAAIAAGMDVLAVGFASTYERATYRAKSLNDVL